jgi:hypothetical protein
MLTGFIDLWVWKLVLSPQGKSAPEQYAQRNIHIEEKSAQSHRTQFIIREWRLLYYLLNEVSRFLFRRPLLATDNTSQDMYALRKRFYP